MNPREIAEQWLKDNPNCAGRGYVIVFNGVVCGWTESLSNERAREWKQGCIAVPPYRNSALFIATEPDPYGWGGSAFWERVSKHIYL